MGTKHAKKRFLIIRYTRKPDGKFDELVELSRKKIGPTKMLEFQVVLDLINKQVLRCSLPGLDGAPYEKLEQHYRKYYSEAIDNFIKV